MEAVGHERWGEEEKGRKAQRTEKEEENKIKIKNKNKREKNERERRGAWVSGSVGR